MGLWKGCGGYLPHRGDQVLRLHVSPSVTCVQDQHTSQWLSYPSWLPLYWAGSPLNSLIPAAGADLPQEKCYATSSREAMQVRMQTTCGLRERRATVRMGPRGTKCMGGIGIASV